jgi:hypothetical protein
MACGGLKFVESNLGARQLKSLQPHLRATVTMAFQMMKFIDDYTYKAGKKLRIKIGVHYAALHLWSAWIPQAPVLPHRRYCQHHLSVGDE